VIVNPERPCPQMKRAAFHHKFVFLSMAIRLEPTQKGFEPP
jgi:hypothetical protein